MNLKNKNVLFVSAYAANYGGNFILSLESLADLLGKEYDCNVNFLFPSQEEKQWIDELKKKYKVSFIKSCYKSSEKEIEHFINEWNIDLVYTHFDAYDIPVAKAIEHSNRNVKMVWHQHNHLYLYMDITKEKFKFLRKLKRNFCYWLQYGYYGKNAYFIPVSYEVGNFVCHYRNHFFTFPKENLSIEEYENIPLSRATMVPNGISLDRIRKDIFSPFSRAVPRFLSFGGETFYKGIACICDAADILWGRGYRFEVAITKGGNTKNFLDDKYGHSYPKWCKLIEQSNNISDIFMGCDAYISASYREGCSYAVAEATIYGLPMIQSDIPGTAFNAKNPSVLLFKRGDAIDLANRMEFMLNMDKDDLREKCMISSENIRRQMSMTNWCNSLLDIYKNL